MFTTSYNVNAKESKQTQNPFQARRGQSALSPPYPLHKASWVAHCLSTKHMETKCCQQDKWWFRSIWAWAVTGWHLGHKSPQAEFCHSQARGELKRNYSNKRSLLPPASLISVSSLPISKPICTDIHKKSEIISLNCMLELVLLLIYTSKSHKETKLDLNIITVYVFWHGLFFPLCK